MSSQAVVLDLRLTKSCAYYQAEGHPVTFRKMVKSIDDLPIKQAEATSSLRRVGRQRQVPNQKREGSRQQSVYPAVLACGTYPPNYVKSLTPFAQEAPDLTRVILQIAGYD